MCSNVRDDRKHFRCAIGVNVPHTQNTEHVLAGRLAFAHKIMNITLTLNGRRTDRQILSTVVGVLWLDGHVRAYRLRNCQPNHHTGTPWL